jgi:thiol-disulfide isomerase/thioredoxin
MKILKLLPIFCLLVSYVLAQQANSNRKILLKSQIEQSPDNLKLHEEFISLSFKDINLEPQYKAWLVKFPKSAIVPFAIGKNLFHQDEPRNEFFLIEAVKRNPNFANAYYLLAINAQKKQNLDEEIIYSKKAEIADKTNGKYAFEAAYVYYEKDKIYADSVMLEVARKFKINEFGAKALFFLAYQESNLTIKKAYLTQLYQDYRENPNPFFNNGINLLYDIYINEGDYESAIKLSINMIVSNNTDRLNWKHLLKTANQFLLVKDYINTNQPDSALKIIEAIKLKNSFSVSFIPAENSLLTLKIKCLNMIGKSDLSYQILLLTHSKNPTLASYKLLSETGFLLRKSSLQIDSAIKVERYKEAMVATNLTRINLLDSTKVSLSDFKGKVILLSFWYPSCGPCRAEMPHLENVLKDFDRDKIVYLAINVLPKEDSLVKNFIKKGNYSFMPLNDDLYGNKGVLKAQSFPSNYLIDKDGKIVFKNFLINKDNEEVLNLMISDLLEY